MCRVTFDLGGSALVALDQDAVGVALLNDCCREVERFAENGGFGFVDVWNDLLCRLSGAGGDTGQGQRGAHEPEEVPSAERVVCRRSQERRRGGETIREIGGARQLFEALPVVRSASGLELGADSTQVHRAPRGDRVVHR